MQIMFALWCNLWLLMRPPGAVVAVFQPSHAQPRPSSRNNPDLCVSYFDRQPLRLNHFRRRRVCAVDLTSSAAHTTSASPESTPLLSTFGAGSTVPPLYFGSNSPDDGISQGEADLKKAGVQPSSGSDQLSFFNSWFDQYNKLNNKSSHRQLRLPAARECQSFATEKRDDLDFGSMDKHVLVLDIENIRGKSGFAWSHDALFESIYVWSLVAGFPGSLVLVVDHGSRPDVYWWKPPLPPRDHFAVAVDPGSSTNAPPHNVHVDTSNDDDTAMAIVFAGPSWKADDVMANDIVPYYMAAYDGDIRTMTVTLVTADHQLIQRCSRSQPNRFQQTTASSFTNSFSQQRVRKRRTIQSNGSTTTTSTNHHCSRLHVLSPTKFLEDLDQISHMLHGRDSNRNMATITNIETFMSDSNDKDKEVTENHVDLPDEAVVQALDREIALATQLLEAQHLLRTRIGVGRKRHKKLQYQIIQLQNKLCTSSLSSSSILASVTALLDKPLQQQQPGSGDIGRTDALGSINNGFNVNGDNGSGSMTRSQQDALLTQWHRIQQKYGVTKQKKERTGDRILLAERLRRHLEQCAVPRMTLASSDPSASQKLRHRQDDLLTLSPASDYVYYRQTNQALPRYPQRQNMIEGTPALSITLSTVVAPEKPSRAPQPRSEGIQTVKLGTLRIVVVSDTHGMEDQLPPLMMQRHQEKELQQPTILPPGDMLLHLGDFAIDPAPNALVKMDGLRCFDTWLAAQPHPIKIVLRGNHDPRRIDFPQSNAVYVTRPMPMKVGDYMFVLIPYTTSSSSTATGSARSLHKQLPAACDVVVSHVPPRGILDRTYQGKHVGSYSMRRLIEHQMKGGPAPLLWLCGHIHESRGVVRHVFDRCSSSSNNNNNNSHRSEAQTSSATRETLVINAASANAGRATRMEYGPVVLQLESIDEETEVKGTGSGGTVVVKPKKQVRILEMDGQYEHLNQSNQSFFTAKSRSNEVDEAKTLAQAAHSANVSCMPATRSMLLAVDLGLRTGVSLFDEHGHLLRYDYFHFDTAEGLQLGAEQLLTTWEREVSCASADQCAVTHIAIEGASAPYLDAWKNVANDGGKRSILLVRPEEWRADLLTCKEQLNGESCKAASRLIARQIVADYSSDNLRQMQDKQQHVELDKHRTKIPTDLAESLLVGLHVARRLGWITRNPAVRRYTNGKVIVPTGCETPTIR